MGGRVNRDSTPESKVLLYSHVRSRLSWSLLFTKKAESHRTQVEACGSRACEIMICHLNAWRRVYGSMPTANWLWEI